MSHDGTILVITAKHLAEPSAGDCQFHVSVHVGIVSTAVNFRYFHVRLTAHNDNQVAVHVGILSGAYQLRHVQRTGGSSSCWQDIRHINDHIAINDALLVTGSVCLMHGAAIYYGVGLAIDIGTGINLPDVSFLILVMTISTAEHVAYLEAAYNIYIRLRNGSSITSTIDGLNTDVFTSVDDDMRLFAF